MTNRELCDLLANYPDDMEAVYTVPTARTTKHFTIHTDFHTDVNDDNQLAINIQ